MQITVNGSTITIEKNIKTLTQLADHLTIDLSNKIIEYNNSIINKTDYKNITLKPNDNIEIIQFMGGGNINENLNTE